MRVGLLEHCATLAPCHRPSHGACHRLRQHSIMATLSLESDAVASTRLGPAGPRPPRGAGQTAQAGRQAGGGVLLLLHWRGP